MRTTAAICLLLALAGLARGQSSGVSARVAARTTLHDDGTRTDSVKDLFKHQLTETTYDARGIVIAKKSFLLGESGDPTQGVIYDGADNIIARVKFIADDLGRIVEEQLSNNQGEIFQRVIRQYDSTGKPSSPKVINLPVRAPNMRPATIDLTYAGKAPPPRSSKDGTQPARGPGGPQVETVEPRSGTVNVTPAYDPASPPNLQFPQNGQAQGTPRPAEPPKEDPKKRSKLNPFNWFKKDK